MEKFTQKSSLKNLQNLLKKLHFSMRSFAVGIILSIIFFYLLSNTFKSYRSDVLILVNVKSQTAISQQQYLLSSITEFPKTLSFYDRLLKSNPDVRDVAAGKSDFQRKRAWNKMLSVEKTNKQNLVFVISISTKIKSDAEQLSIKTVRTLFDTIAMYYDVKNDVDLRIIDGPIAKAYCPWYVFPLSIILGFAFAVTLSYGFSESKKHFKEKEIFFNKNLFFDFGKKSDIPAEKEMESLRKLYEQNIDQVIIDKKKDEMESKPEKENKSDDLKFQEIKKITKKIEPGKYPNFPEMPAEKKKAGAPDNLPIADDSFLEQYHIPKPEKETSADEIEKPTSKEPTSEELKNRLNKLLKGDL